MAARRPGRRSVAAFAILLSALTAVSALATGFFPVGLQPFDRKRLEAFETVRASAIAEARGGGAPADVATLVQVLAGEPIALTPAQMAGEWRCRILKLGGLLPLTIYPDFRCRIVDDAGGLRIEKLTGSQRLSGVLYDLGEEARLGYAGALNYAEEPWIPYGRDPDRDQVGYLIPVAPDRMRLELPLPAFESRFDILELRR